MDSRRYMQTEQLEQKILLSLQKLKDVLGQVNLVSASNQNCLTANLQILIIYVRDGMRAMINITKLYRQKHKILLNFIRKQGITHLLDYSSIQLPRNTQLQLTNRQLSQRILHTHKSIQQNEQEGKGPRSKEKRKRKGLREKAKQQYNIAVNYINQHLRHILEETTDHSYLLPKNVILNLFVKWQKDNGYATEYSSLGMVQMGLTNQLKKHFPLTTHTPRLFKGLKFKQGYQDFINFTSTRATMAQEGRDQQSSIDSPPLPSFDDDHLAQQMM